MHAFTTMSKRKKLIFAVILGIAVLCLSMTAVFASKSTSKKSTSSASKKSLTQKAKLASGAKALTSKKGKAITKQETVYVKADASGTRKATYVSDWLQNAGNEKNLKDISNLSNIENVKGYEKYTKSGNTLTWKTKGKDIYYRGTTDQTLPINVQINYELDGQSVTPQEIAGKSGKVKITINYNNEGETNGLTTPFAVATALDLPTSRFSNVKVTNGAVVSDGQNNAVVGIAFPGLKENLGLSSVQGVKIPDSVTITAKVKNFKLGPTITSASTDVLNRAGLKDIKSFKDLDAAIDKLETASGQLVAGSLSAWKGSAQLSAGAYTLSNGTNTLVTGLNQYTAGVASAASGGNSLASGSASLASGMGQLDSAVPTLTSSIKQLHSGSQTLVNYYGDAKTEDTILYGADQVNTSMQQLKDNKKTIDSLSTALKQLQSVDTNKISSQLNDIIKNYQSNLQTEYTSVQALTTSAQSLSQVAQDLKTKGDIENAQKVANQAQDIGKQAQTLGNKVQSDKQALEDAKDSLNDLNTLNTTLNSINQDDLKTMETLITNTTSDTQMAKFNKFYNGLQKIAAGTKSLSDNLGKLESSTKDLPSNIDQLNEGSKQLASGSKTLSDGLNTLNANSGALNSGASQLSNGSKQLYKGSVTLSDGLSTLYYGMNQFKTTGIDKIAAVYNNNFKNLASKLNAIKKASEDYNNFSGIEPGMKGSVNFIIETDSISK
jgi:putative membrane protein